MAFKKTMETEHQLRIHGAYYELEYLGWSKGTNAAVMTANFAVYVSKAAKLAGAPHFTTKEVTFPMDPDLVAAAYTAIRSTPDFSTPDVEDV